MPSKWMEYSRAISMQLNDKRQFSYKTSTKECKKKTYWEELPFIHRRKTRKTRLFREIKAVSVLDLSHICTSMGNMTHTWITPYIALWSLCARYYSFWIRLFLLDFYYSNFKVKCYFFHIKNSNNSRQIILLMKLITSN